MPRNIREKLGNSANGKENLGNIRLNVYLCFLDQSISLCAQQKIERKRYSLNETVGFYFP